MTEQRQLETATRFYGVELVDIPIAGETENRALQTAIEQKQTRAVIVAADALSHLSKESLFRLLPRKAGNALPVLILGVTPATQTDALASWTNGSVAKVRQLDDPYSGALVFRSVPGVTRQLSGLELPMAGKQMSYFVLSAGESARQVMAVRSEDRVLPTFIQTEIDGHDVFVAAQSSLAAEQSNSGSMLDTFAAAAPAMMFVRYAIGEWGWHAAQHYANLTIDDPWLRERYGYVNYAALLQEMEKHNFHTTIAFIPWNYDRSQPAVVSLFRSHPERFSISIHGDNHDHQEFPALNKKPLNLQTADLRESLNRMDKFQDLTGIPYDRIMIFPHNIGSQEILAALKTYNFLATVNYSNVPIDGDAPSAGYYPMRPVTLQWSDFPSISRISAGLSDPAIYIAVNEFLDNPLLFYCHHDFFAAGIEAFDNVADDVNKIEPNTRWMGLGDIVKRMYLLKLRSDSNYDVLAFSKELALENASSQQSIFFVRKREAGSSAIASVTTDGQPIPFWMEDEYLRFSVAVPGGETRHIAIAYEANSQTNFGTAPGMSLRVFLVRRASDFRDNVISRTAAGRLLIGLYYKKDISAALPVIVVVIALVLCCGCVVGIRRAILSRGRSVCRQPDVRLANSRSVS